MKICFVHEEYPDETNFGGIATYQKIMAEYLASRGNTVYVIARSLRRDSEEIINGVHITRIFVDNYETKNGAKKYRQKICNILRQMQSEEKIDIIETPDWSASTVYFEKYRKVPLVVRLHTPLKIWLKYNNNEFGVLKTQMLKWENQMLKKADVLTSCSSILKKMVISEYDISNKIINVIPNPANIVDFYCDNKIKKANNLLFVGSLEERKGVVVLAKALNLVFKERPNISIIFIGKDTVRNHKNISTKKLILDIVKKEYHDKITFLGQIANKDLNRYFNEARVAIFPSLFDNFPYVVLEAMATGIEIVGSKNSGMVDMLNNYNEMIPENNEKLENPSPDKTYFAILDGQQRTQSLYIGLKGYLKLKIYRARKNNVESYKNKYLYINLIGEESELDEYKYEFKFFADEELKNKENENKFFFRVGKILQYDRLPNINDIENLYPEKQAGAILFRNAFYIPTHNLALNEYDVKVRTDINKQENIDNIVDKVYEKLQPGGLFIMGDNEKDHVFLADEILTDAESLFIPSYFAVIYKYPPVYKALTRNNRFKPVHEKTIDSAIGKMQIFTIWQKNK